MNTRQLALIPTGIALNVALGKVVQELGLPIYLDAVGTILVTALLGAGSGVLTGVLSQVLTAFFAGQMMWLAFTPIQLIIALIAALASGRGGFRSVGRAALWGVACGFFGGTASAAISYSLFRGVTAPGVTALGALFRSLGLPLERAVTFASISTDLVDKGIAFGLVAAVLLALPVRMASRFPTAVRATGRGR